MGISNEKRPKYSDLQGIRALVFIRAPPKNKFKSCGVHLHPHAKH